MANLLTGLRLLLVVPVAFAFANPDFVSPLVLVAMVFVAIASDYFDGKVARLTNTASPRGQVFDHATDFLFVTCGLGGVAAAGLVTPLLPILIVIAFSQYVLDSHFFYHEKQLHMSFLGRWNGVFYFVPLCLIAASRLTLLENFFSFIELLVVILGWILACSTVLSIADRAIAPLRTHQNPD
jgi:phosphatidylglycerophosphate synthase